MYPRWLKIAVAASFIITVSIAGYFYINNRSSVADHPILIAGSQDVRPGGNKATLILSGGQTLSLTDAETGELSEDAGVAISKTTDGEIIYTPDTHHRDAGQRTGEARVNIIQIPNGGQYQVRLQDGTKVWLNAASTLKYPVDFTAEKERSVVLEGEAYFEVAKDPLHPFIVKSAGQTVEVLGTHFNINSYRDERSIKTTLLEGSVRVNGHTTLKPGQQSQVSGESTTVINNADTEEAVAWMNGYFKFNGNLETTMAKIARWYNIEVEYKMSPDPNFVFRGEISKNRNLSEVLQMLGYTGNIHFEINGNKVIVTK